MAILYINYGLNQAWAEREKLQARLEEEKDCDIIVELTGQLNDLEKRIDYLQDMAQ